MKRLAEELFACGHESALAVHRRLLFVGRLDHAKGVQYLIAADFVEADIVVVPSIWPEPVGLVVPEALRFGNAVVVFDSGGLAEWSRFGGQLQIAPDGDVNGLAEALRRTAADRDKSHSVSRERPRFAEVVAILEGRAELKGGIGFGSGQVSSTQAARRVDV